jgi:hypothetical protein
VRRRKRRKEMDSKLITLSYLVNTKREREGYSHVEREGIIFHLDPPYFIHHLGGKLLKT